MKRISGVFHFPGSAQDDSARVAPGHRHQIKGVWCAKYDCRLRRRPNANNARSGSTRATSVGQANMRNLPDSRSSYNLLNTATTRTRTSQRPACRRHVKLCQASVNGVPLGSSPERPVIRRIRVSSSLAQLPSREPGRFPRKQIHRSERLPSQ